jgi:hypothetical protein
MPLLLITLALIALTAIGSIRTRRRGQRMTSIFLTMLAWLLLGFLLFVLLV